MDRLSGAIALPEYLIVESSQAIKTTYLLTGPLGSGLMKIATTGLDGKYKLKIELKQK